MSLNVTIFVGTSAILLVILYGYFAQVSRAAEADRIYTATQAHFETALMRGRCGLWTGDLASGRLFWSRSIFELLGLEPRDALLGYGEVARLMHPEDGDLMTLAESMYGSAETTVDRNVPDAPPGRGAGCGCGRAPSWSMAAGPSRISSASPST